MLLLPDEIPGHRVVGGHRFRVRHPTFMSRNGLEVTAETLYEAAATALSIFRRSEWADVIGPNTELHVAVKNPETMHRVTPEQIRRWCDGVAVSPDEVLKRRRVKTLIG